MGILFLLENASFSNSLLIGKTCNEMLTRGKRMRTLFCFMFLICFVMTAGCSDSDIAKYDDEDVAAIVRGEEITIGDLRFLFLDDQILESLDGTIKAKLAEQEVKRLNIDVSQELQEIQEMKHDIGIYPPEDLDTEFGEGIREFAETQAAKLGMDPEEYFEKYLERNHEISVYVIAYIEEMLGEPTTDEEYMEKANKLLDDLADENADEVQILIK